MALLSRRPCCIHKERLSPTQQTFRTSTLIILQKSQKGIEGTDSNQSIDAFTAVAQFRSMQSLYLLHENVPTSTYDEHIIYIERPCQGNHRTPLIHVAQLFLYDVDTFDYLATSTFETQREQTSSFKLTKCFILFLSNCISWICINVKSSFSSSRGNNSFQGKHFNFGIGQWYYI